MMIFHKPTQRCINYKQLATAAYKHTVKQDKLFLNSVQDSTSAQSHPVGVVFAHS